MDRENEVPKGYRIIQGLMLVGIFSLMYLGLDGWGWMLLIFFLML